MSRPISKQLAEIVNKRWASKLGENKVKETVEKYNRPENCEKLLAPKVNPEIWEKLTHYGKKQDLRLSAIQNMIVKVGAIIAQSTQKLMEFFSQGPLPVQVETTENLEEKGGNQQKINTADDIMFKLHMLQVTQFEDFIPKLIAYLVAQTSCFKSGRLAKFTHCWQKITSDTEILQMVSGQYIEFDTKPCQTHPPAMKCFSAEENDIISKEVANLLEKAAIVETSHEPGEFISSVFV